MESYTIAFLFLAVFAQLSCSLTVGHNGLPKASVPKYTYKQIPSDNGIETFEIMGEPNSGNADQYMDEVFEKLKIYMDQTGLNEYPLPDKVFQFKKTILGVTFSGKFGLQNGYIRGLDSIHRTGDCNIRTVGDDMAIDTNAGLQNAKLGYDSILMFMGKSLRGSVSGTVDQCAAKSTLVVKEMTNVTMTYFHITEIGNVSIDITGLGKFGNYFAEMFADLIAKLTKNSTPRLLDPIFKVEIQKIIDQLPIPDIGSDL